MKAPTITNPTTKVTRPFLLNVALNCVPETKFCAMKGKVQQINMQ